MSVPTTQEVDVPKITKRAKELGLRLYLQLLKKVKPKEIEDAHVMLNAGLNLMTMLMNTIVKPEDKQAFIEETARLLKENIVNAAESVPTV